MDQASDSPESPSAGSPSGSLAHAHRALVNLVLLPLRDVLRGLDAILGNGPKALLPLIAGLCAGWWIYVPIHELLHAGGCVIAGGQVERLEISPLYLGGVFERLFPWVEAGGDYAGRLAAFDTGGSDWVYWVTVLAPYALTVFPGVPWFYAAIRRARPFSMGASLPFALAPFLALTGDAYEAASILTTRLPPWSHEAIRHRLRGEDLILRWQDLSQGAPLAVWFGFLATALAGVVGAWLLYGFAARLASAWERPQL